MPRKHEVLSWGFVSEDGEVNIEPQYRNVLMFKGNYTSVQDDTEYWYIIDRTGKAISDTKLSDMPVKAHGMQGYFTFYKEGYAGLYCADNDTTLIQPNEYIDINYTGYDDIFEIVKIGPDDIISDMDDEYAGLYDLSDETIVLEADKYEHVYYMNVGWFAEIDVIGGVATQKITWRLNDDYTEWFIVTN